MITALRGAAIDIRGNPFEQAAADCLTYFEDALILIEDGAITKPACNFRFNESPVAMLNKVVAMGPSVRAYGDESQGLPVAVPQMLVDEFTLSSVSDAV